MRMSTFSGDQLAQVNNPDPFAMPVLRSPVWRTPGWLTVIVQFVRLLLLLVRFLARHPLLDLTVSVLAFTYAQAGWPGLLALVLITAAVLAVWRWRWPRSFTRFAGQPARARWRRWHYRRHWIAVLTVSGLAVVFRGRMLMPVLGKITSTRSVRGYRTLPMDDMLVAALRALHKQQAAEKLAAGPAYEDAGYVVIDELGSPVHPEWFSDEFHRVRERAGLPRIRLHDSRHTANSLMAAAGVPPHIRAAWCGHTEAVNEGAYTHARPEDMATAMAALTKIQNGA